MNQVKLYNPKQILLAVEIAQRLHSDEVGVSGSILWFTDDVAEDLADVAGDAAHYWQAVKKPGMAKLAEHIRTRVNEVAISNS